MTQDTILTFLLLGIGTAYVLWQSWYLVPWPKVELDEIRREFSETAKDFRLPDVLIDSSLSRRLRRTLFFLTINGAYATAAFFFQDIPGSLWGGIVLILVEAGLIHLVSIVKAKKAYSMDLYHARKIMRDHMLKKPS